ncbi:ferredoxin--NADP reductase [Acidocella sp.]|uniref:ferredoxin--NADP reductase n=1 Tax=Acidocella sp. TaxID=50710 RepID=UPI00262944EE|nr:ferredoxin--NADP reductase [Acidocella sp.]
MATNLYTETVTSLTHWTDTLFSFQTTRNPGFRFLCGQSTPLGIVVDGHPLMDGENPVLKPASMCSAVHEEHLEFFCSTADGGDLVKRLAAMKAGDEVVVGGKPTGALTLNNLQPGAKQLYLFATTSGISPLLSVIKDIDTYEFYDYIVFVHSARHARELAFTEASITNLLKDEYFEEIVLKKLFFYPTVTGEPYLNVGRITKLLEQGKLEMDLGMPPLDIETDRVVLCGNKDMVKDVRTLIEARGFTEGSHQTQGHFLVETAL